MGEVCHVCCTTLETETYCPKCQAATATGPERDLAEQALEKLEWLVGKSKTIGARKEWYDKGRQWLAVTWDGGQYAYFTRDGERTRAEALALLKGAKDAG